MCGRLGFALHVSYLAVYLDVEDVREYCEYYTIYADDLILRSSSIKLKIPIGVFVRLWTVAKALRS